MNRATLFVLLGGVALTAAFIFAPGADQSGPFVPKSDDQVLEQVPKSTPRPTTPLTVDEAAVRARQLIDEARKEGGDPRLLGRAQATLAPWWADASPPPQIRILRATLKQSFHDFEGALVDLEAQVAADPSDAQAWLTRATVLSVLARYPEAQASCEKLEGISNPVVVAVCRAQVMGVTGRAKEAMTLLESLTPAAEERGWVLSVRGELAHWSGDDTRAEATLTQALTVDPNDTYSRLLLAQVLLDGGQPARAAKLFEGRAVNDGELLMQVLALSAAKSPDYETKRAELDERVAANRQRGETLHQREESRYALALEGDVNKALELAVKNWAVQKEPADARVLLEAAAAAKSPQAAQPVVKWLAQTNFTQPKLNQLSPSPRGGEGRGERP
ncbi:MAG: tetratricopeptide repeat protein [Archangium sp.]|nr:tetratricopeptide repeat protein [Archangium sp.]MDP3573435.1 tetratricopeptide repeat protein [Archangium sp.]